MQINKNSWHYQFWSITHPGTPPSETNLCRYCQRIFWFGLLVLLMAAAGLWSVGGIAYGIFYLGLYQNTLPTLTVFGVLAAVVGLVVLLRRWRRTTKYREPGLVGQWVRAKKDRVCPLISFTRNG